MSILKRFCRPCDFEKEKIELCFHCMTLYCHVLLGNMDKQTVSFRLEADKVAALDALAGLLDRDRTYLLGEAVQAYLETQQWHLREIEKGIADADAGRVVDHATVKAMASKWRRRK
jgi:predicted transcriptional regulator